MLQIHSVSILLQVVQTNTYDHKHNIRPNKAQSNQSLGSEYSLKWAIPTNEESNDRKKHRHKQIKLKIID